MKEQSDFNGINFYNYAKALAILNENLTMVIGLPQVEEEDESQLRKVRIKVVDAMESLLDEHFSENK